MDPKKNTQFQMVIFTWVLNQFLGCVVYITRQQMEGHYHFVLSGGRNVMKLLFGTTKVRNAVQKTAIELTCIDANVQVTIVHIVPLLKALIAIWEQVSTTLLPL